MRYAERATLKSRIITPHRCCANCANVCRVRMKSGDNSTVLQCFCLCDLQESEEELSRAYDTLNKGLSGKPVEDTNYSPDVYSLLGIFSGKSYQESLRYVRDPMSVCQYYEMFF